MPGRKLGSSGNISVAEAPKPPGWPREGGIHSIAKDETKRTPEDTGPGWDVFKRVINGDGPCHAERLAVRRWAEEKGRWVRHALLNKQDAYVAPLA